MLRVQEQDCFQDWFMPKNPFYISRKSLEKKKEVFCLSTIRWAWLYYDEDENSVYCIIC